MSKLEDINSTTKFSDSSLETSYPPKVLSVLSGNILENIIKSLQPNKKLIIFVSSTFTDTYKERNVLQERILSELQKIGYENDIHVLLYDMRFGIKDESTLDHTTWECCQAGIKECHAKSDGIFFLSLQGDKYGYRPLPKLIDRDFFEKTLKNHTNNEDLLKIAQDWYHLNENYFIPKYELKNLRSNSDNEYWNVVLPRLRDELLTSVPFDENVPELLIGRSITEWEVLLAKQLSTRSKVGVWIKKEFDQQSFEGLEPNGRPSDFNDGLTNEGVAVQLGGLKEEMQQCFEVLHPLPLQKLSVADYVTDGEANKAYLEKWEIIVKNRLCEEVEYCAGVNKSFTTVATAFALPVEHLEEMLHHCYFTFQKATSFIGREDLVDAVLKILSSKNKRKVIPPELIGILKVDFTFAPINAAVIGQSGAGKTALMAKVASLVSSQLSEEETLPIITRYCGTSKFSLHGIDLIYSISLQLLTIYGKKDEIIQLLKTMPTNKYEQAVALFSSLLEQYPVILFVDSVDQLSNNHEARSKLSFLRNLKVHEKSKIIISTLPDEYDEINHKWKYRYLCEKVVRDHKIPVVEMKHHNADEATIRSLLEKLLANRGKRISADQWSLVLSSASQEPTMLYLNLSLEIITKWRSWEKDLELKPTVKALINQIFDNLEKNYGKSLICNAFSFITFSRDGISDQEMTDCLSRQSEVFQEVCQYWQGVKTIPLHVWLRVKQAVTALLAEKDHSCLKWHHRQLWEAAQERYEELRKSCHQIMGGYFSEQPLCLTELDVWHPESKINTRRVREGYYHLYAAEQFQMSVEELCNFEMICALALTNDAFHALNYLSKLYSQLELKDNEHLDHYYRWMRKSINTFMINPRINISSTASEEPIISIVYKENMRRYLEQQQPDCASVSSYKSMTTVQALGGQTSFDTLIATLIGHSKSIVSVAWSPDGAKIASGSEDRSIKIWDPATGELLSTLEGHEGMVASVSWHPNGILLASGSYDCMSKIWDTSTGELLKTLEAVLSKAISVSWNHDGSKIALGRNNGEINIWDTDTWILLKTMNEWVGDSVTKLSWSPDGSKIVTGSVGKKTKLWDSSTGELLRTFEGQESEILALTWNHDGGKIICGSKPRNIEIWDTSTGALLSIIKGKGNKLSSMAFSLNSTQVAMAMYNENVIELWDLLSCTLIKKLEGHTALITTISYNRDGSKLASGSNDQTLKIWDLSLN